MYNTKVIHQILVRMKEDAFNRNKYHGICFNLKHYYEHFGNADQEHSNYEVSEFIFECFTSLFGKYEPFPIEKERRIHYSHANEDKWDLRTKFGNARFKLLDDMIKYCEDKLESRK